MPRTTFTIACCFLVTTSCVGENSDMGGQQVPQWLADEDLRIGSVDDERYALTWFRQILVSEAGRMFTLHPQEQLVRSFDSDGTFLRTIGRRGDGPGEFENVFNMGWVADTLWVLDGSGYAFEQFNEDGEFLGSFSVPFVMETNPGEASPPRANGLLADGTVYGAPVAWSNLVATGAVTHHVPMLMTRDGRVTDTLPAIPFGNNQWAIYDPDDPDRGGSYGLQPFADGPLWSYARDGRSILRLDRDSPETPQGASFSLTRLSFSGDTLWTMDYPFTPVPLREEEIDSVIEARATPLGERGFLGLTVQVARDWARRTLYTPPFKSHVVSMIPGRDGSIWLGTTARPDSTEWMIVDPAGEPRARVTLPNDLTVLEADGEHVWGSTTDDLEVPYLVRYRIRESAL